MPVASLNKTIETISIKAKQKLAHEGSRETKNKDTKNENKAPLQQQQQHHPQHLEELSMFQDQLMVSLHQYSDQNVEDHVYFPCPCSPAYNPESTNLERETRIKKKIKI